jgi:hypothetical protein
MKCNASLIACLIGLLCNQTAEAGSPNYKKMLSKMPCAAQINAQVGPRIARQTWMPIVISVANEPRHDGIAFRDTRNTEYISAYRLWSHGKKATFIESRVKWGTNIAQDRQHTWDSSKNCDVQVSEATRNLPALPATTGFNDEDLFGRLVNIYWGVIYVTSLYPPAVASLKELKVAVEAKSDHVTGSLTVVLHPDMRKLTTSQLQPLLDTGAVFSATDLRPVVSREILSHPSIRQSGNYPVTLIYRSGLLSNRDYVGPFKRADYARWIDLELDELKKDVTE